MTDPRDEALQRACPVLAAPLFGVLPAMENGQRVIVASNGVFLQIKRDWLDCVERLGGIDTAIPLPYGKITPSVRFTFRNDPYRTARRIHRGGPCRIAERNRRRPDLLGTARHAAARDL